VRYRLYSTADFAALYAIEKQCFAPPLRFGRAYMRQLVNSVNAATWIAEDNGLMAGFAIVEWDEDGLGINAYLQTIEVASEQRGQGIGAELLRRAEDSAREAHARAMWLHVDMANTAAIRMYERHGYQRQGREEDYYGRRRAAWVYMKLLDVPRAGTPPESS
jgi:ribosomal protein S18 acetylase RimI-like enzyme